MAKPNLNKLCTFIPVSDSDTFADYDNHEGYGNGMLVEVEGGIVVSSNNAKIMRKFVSEFEVWNKDD